MSSVSQHPHIVIAGVEPWGHARPLCAFAAKVVLTRDIYVTFITPPRVVERIKKEIARGFNPQDVERLKLIRVVAIDNLCEGLTNFGEIMKAEQERYFVSFMTLYEQLLDEQPITCFVTKTEFPAVRSPSIFVVDFMVGPLAGMIHKLEKNKAKVYGFCSGMASFLYVSFAPAERGGRGDFKDKVIQEAAKSGRNVNDIAEEMVHTFTDDILQIPGFPKMYHWEFDPQNTKMLTSGFIGALWLALFDTWEACDGVIITSPEVYEPAAIAAVRDWYGATGRGTWAIGPLLPDLVSKEAVAGEAAQSDKAADITQFMDSVLAKHGPQSLLYVSFGSAFWPSEPEKLEAFIEVVIEKKIPFIFSHGSPLAQLTDSFKHKVAESGLGLLSPWSPQQTILVHPALGWFVSHCGHNSTLEAISSGIPLICWPFHADQPANAVNLAENHNVAYELLEVRTGSSGRKPLYRTGKAPSGTLDAVREEARQVLDKAFGEDGAKKRANAKKLQEKVLSAWNKGGSAEVEMGRLLDTLQA